METFYIGQTFDRPAPPQASEWCNKNNAKIVKNGRIRTIIALPTPKTTTADLVEFLYQEKCKVAYRGVTVVKDDTEYLFETNQDSITMCNSMALALANQPDDFAVSWKVWQGGSPSMLTITKKEFNTVFTFGMRVVNTAFGVEGALNAQAQALTEDQLADTGYINAFKEGAVIQFAAVNKVLYI